MAEADKTTNSGPEVLEFKSDKEKKADRVLLFTIDDEEFTVPAKPGMRVVMRYLNVARKTGNDLYAAQQLVEDMLGSDKWERFLDWDGMDDKIMNAVVEKCINLAVTSVEENAKN